MNIWVDADACPKPIKEILFRVAIRVNIPVILVANQALFAPNHVLIRRVQVEQGIDVADNYIALSVVPGDLVITADIPLAAAVIDKGALALNPRGELYDKNNIGQRLETRNLLDELRGAGLVTGGPAPFGPKERQRFANTLDRLLAQRRT